MAALGVIHVEVDGQTELAWTCGCGEVKPGEQQALVKWEEPIRGVHYSVSHMSCIQPAAPPNTPTKEVRRG